jgi:small subunit ribosomal protein S4
MLNGRKTNIPSALVKSGDNISVRSQSQKKKYFTALRQDLDDRQVPRWLNLDAKNMSAQVIQLPSREDIDVSLNEQLIVEYYSR